MHNRMMLLSNKSQQLCTQFRIIDRTRVCSTAIAFTIATSFILASNQTSTAAEFIIGDNCSRQATLDRLPTPGSESYFYSIYRRYFTIQNTTYWFYQARYTDGSSILCISLPNFQQPRLIQDERMSSQFINSISQQGEGSPIFTVTVVHGQNTGVPATDYRLDLQNPRQPRITKIRDFIIWFENTR